MLPHESCVQRVSSAFASRALRLALLAAGYYVAGRLALLMAIPPGYATPVWPAAGFALVGLLALGWRAFPAVVVGSFFVNLETGFDASTVDAAWRSGLIASAIAMGAGAQAAIGAEGIRRVLGYPHPFDEQRDIVRFLLIGGPLACVVSATCGSAALWAAGMVTARALPFSWFTWWVGDSIGVLVFAPLLLAIFGEPQASWRRRLWAVGLAPLLGFVMVVGLFLWVSRREQARLEVEFIRRCEPIAEAVQAAVDQYVHLGGAVASLLRVVPELDEAAFESFATDLLARQPGLSALSRIERVTEAQRPAWEAAHGHPITRLAADGTLVPAEAAGDHYVVSWIVPDAGNAGAVGYDVGSESLRLAALRSALATGQPTASPAVHLVQDVRQGLGVLVLERVSAEAGTDAGLASTVLSLDQLVSAAVLGLETEGVRLRLLDGDTELFSDPGATGGGPHWEATLPVAGRLWRAEFRPTPEYSQRQRTWEAPSVLVFGLALVALAEFALLVSTGRELRLIAAEDRGSALLRAMPDAILRLGPDGVARDYRPPASEGASESWGGSSDLAMAGAGDRLLGSLQEVRSSGTAKRLEYQVVTESGTLDLEARLVAGVGDDVLVVIRDVSAQKAIERRMRSALAEKDVLLREIHHRVKNNLQVVSSLLNLADDRLEDPGARALLAHTRDRVRTIALVHDQLHRSADLAQVGFGAYLRVLATHLPQVVGEGSDRIGIVVSGEDLTLPLDIAVPCGLIVNELVTNAFQHAFPNHRWGTVSISIRGRADGRVELVVRDDGDGPPPGWDPRAAGGTGLELVFTFADQVDAEVSVVVSSGVSFSFVFAGGPA
ncbi:hypothetical protein LBMAG42_17180 [Deltaproteobacteria bacterium]|nr:hypothetical protein LBMAG42_17180 [Deltaproteobacteria bacterium]